MILYVHCPLICLSYMDCRLLCKFQVCIMHVLMKNELWILEKAVVQSCRTSRCAPAPLLCLTWKTGGYPFDCILLMNQNTVSYIFFKKSWFVIMVMWQRGLKMENKPSLVLKIAFLFNLLLSWNLAVYALLSPSVACLSANFFPKGVQWLMPWL